MKNGNKLKRLLLTAFIFLALLASAQDKESVCREGFKRIDGKWNGMRITVSQSGNSDTLLIAGSHKSDELNLLLKYIDTAGTAIDSSIIEIQPSGKSIKINEDLWLITLAVNDGENAIVVLEKKGRENGKDCQYRTRYTITTKNYQATTEVRHFGEKDFTIRKSFILTKD